MELIYPAGIIILGCVALLLFLQWKNLSRPPCIRGWIPWFGAGFEIGKAPLEFIEKARIKVSGLMGGGGGSGGVMFSFLFPFFGSQVQCYHMGNTPGVHN